MPEGRRASTLRRGIPEKSNAELVGGGLVQSFSAIAKAIISGIKVIIQNSQQRPCLSQPLRSLKTCQSYIMP